MDVVTDHPFADPAVAAAYQAFEPDARAGLMELRHLILTIAAELPRVGPVEECLKWGQPAYLTPKTKAGSTLRLGVPKTGGFALYAHCQTSIIRDFAEAFPGQDQIEGNRAVLFQHAEQITPARHGVLIRHALTYHLPQG